MTLDKTHESREKVRNSDNTISKGSDLRGYFRFFKQGCPISVASKLQ